MPPSCWRARPPTLRGASGASARSCPTASGRRHHHGVCMCTGRGVRRELEEERDVVRSKPQGKSGTCKHRSYAQESLSRALGGGIAGRAYLCPQLRLDARFAVRRRLLRLRSAGLGRRRDSLGRRLGRGSALRSCLLRRSPVAVHLIAIHGRVRRRRSGGGGERLHPLRQRRDLLLRAPPRLGKRGLVRCSPLVRLHTRTHTGAQIIP